MIQWIIIKQNKKSKDFWLKDPSLLNLSKPAATKQKAHRSVYLLKEFLLFSQPFWLT